MTLYRIDRNRYPLLLRQACKTILQTEPYKSAPQHKGVRATLERHVEDLNRDLEA